MHMCVLQASCPATGSGSGAGTEIDFGLADGLGGLDLSGAAHLQPLRTPAAALLLITPAQTFGRLIAVLSRTASTLVDLE